MNSAGLQIPIQLDDFVDRQPLLEDLWQITRGESQYRLCILQGGGGFGKSYLLKEFRAQCNLANVPCGRVFSGKGQDINYLNIVLNIWEDLELGDPREIDHVITKLNARTYKSMPLGNLIANEPPATTETPQTNIFGNIVTGEVHGDVIYRNFMQVVLKDHDLARREVMEAVTRILKERLIALAAKRGFVIIIDSWDLVHDEPTANWLMENLVSWILDGEVAKARLIIAGGKCPMITRLPFLILQRDLQPLPDEDIAAYWVDKCGLPAAQVPEVIEVTSGIPLALCLTASKVLFLQNSPASHSPELEAPESLDTITPNAVSGLLEAMPAELAKLVRVFAIPHWFDEGLFNLFTGEANNAPSLFKQLTRLRFIEDHGDGHFKYSQSVRRYLLSEWLQEKKQQEFVNNCRLFFTYMQNLDKQVSGRQNWNIEKEALYLLFLVDEGAGIKQIGESFENACRSLQYDLAEQYIVLMRELTMFLSNPGKLWLAYYEARLLMLHNDFANAAAELSSMADPVLDPILQAVIGWSQGIILVKNSQWSQATKLYARSLQQLKNNLSPLYIFLITISMGEAYQNLASNSGNLTLEIDRARGWLGGWLYLVQNLPFLIYEWLVHRWGWLPNWFFGNNYQDWIISYLLTEALRWYQRAVAYAENTGNLFWIFESQLAKAAVEQQIGRWSKAHKSYAALLNSELVQKSEYRRALIKLGMGEILANEGKLPEAIATLEELLPVLQKYHDNPNTGLAEARLSQLYQLSNQTDQAIRHNVKSIQAFQQAKEFIMATLLVCRLIKLFQNPNLKTNRGLDEFINPDDFEHKYLARFPDRLLAWYRRIAVWGALPLTYFFFILLSFASALAVTIVEGEWGLFQQGLSIGTTFRDTVVIVSLLVLPIPLSLWLYRGFYSLIGFLVVHRIGRRLVPIEKEQPRYFLVTEKSINYLGVDLQPQFIFWSDIKNIGVKNYSFWFDGLDLFSQTFLILQDGSRVIIEGVTSAYDYLLAELIQRLRNQRSNFEPVKVNIQIVDLKWLTAVVLASIVIVLNLYMHGKITGTYSDVTVQAGINISFGPIAFHLLPTFALLFSTVTLWRLMFHNWMAERKLDPDQRGFNFWLPLTISILSSVILFLWLMLIYG